LPGITAVVDSGLAREPRFDPVRGMSRLETVTVAEPSAVQRAGRAGRVAPGRCYRLWPAQRVLDRSPRAEIHNVDLAAFALELAAWGSADLELLDPAPDATLAQARALLQQLGAFDVGGRITAHGKAVIDLGTHPRLANAMLRTDRMSQALACDVAALIEARDPVRGSAERGDDLRSLHTALLRWRQRAGLVSGASRAALIAIDQAARQWCRRLGVTPVDVEPDDPYALGNILALAYPERIARRDDVHAGRYVLASGQGVHLSEASVLAGSAWLVACDLRMDARDGRVLRAAPCDLEFLRATYRARFTPRSESAFNSEKRAVETIEVESFDGIVLARKTLPTARNASTARALEEGILGLGLAVLPWTESIREWQARIAKLRVWCPELGLPDVSDAALLDAASTWLSGLVSGHARVADITPQALSDVLHARLDHMQRRAVDDCAPTELVVPSGMRRALSYLGEGPPVLRVKLQELFGLAQTPRIARGRVAVMLHLLSPRSTPIQVTQDLQSFWTRTYPEVKKELKGRYPKHPWPDDPWTAPPTHRTKPRTP